ncbi:hypothetical protein [Noviherbaspirillum sp.]|uniref:hypothetical protein n=1 Tax=Noviherbaspirillum sp. TaxID=1926288 RepID=UPI002FE1A2BC
MSVIPAKAEIQSDGVPPEIQHLFLFEETSRDWPRRATFFFASPKKKAKKTIAKSLPLRGSRESDALSGKRNKCASGSDKFRFFIRSARHFLGSAKAGLNSHSLFAFTWSELTGGRRISSLIAAA